MARPQKKIDLVLLEKLTKLQLSNTVIADMVCVSTDTLSRRFAGKMNTWRSMSTCKIAEVLFDEGINKREPWALKALVHKHLGYADKQEIQQTEHLSERSLQVIGSLSGKSLEFLEKKTK